MVEVRPPVRCCRKSKGRRRLSRQPHGRGMNGLQSYRIGRPVNRPAQVKGLPVKPSTLCAILLCYYRTLICAMCANLHYSFKIL